MLTLSLSSSHHHRLSLFVPPSPCFHLRHSFATSLSLSLSHTHTHTHTHSLSVSLSRALPCSFSLPLAVSLSPRVFFPGFSDRARPFPSPRGRRDVCRASRLHACTRGESAYRGRAYRTLSTEFSLHPPTTCSARAAPPRFTVVCPPTGTNIVFTGVGIILVSVFIRYNFGVGVSCLAFKFAAKEAEKGKRQRRSSFVPSWFRFSVVGRSSCTRARGESRIARKRSSYLAREHCRVTLVAFALGG